MLYNVVVKPLNVNFHVFLMNKGKSINGKGFFFKVPLHIVHIINSTAFADLQPNK